MTQRLSIQSSGGSTPNPPSLRYLWALGTLAIPAMSAECERVFSSTKKLITPGRNRLGEESIEASECLKNWWDRGLITQQEDAEVTHEGSDIEGESETSYDQRRGHC